MQRFFHVVGNKYHRQRQLLVQLFNQILKLPPRNRVERGKRLVHQQHLRLGGNGAQNPHTLLLAARQFARIAAQVFFRRQAHLFEQFPRTLPPRLFAPALHLGNQADVFLYRHVGKQRNLLQHIARRKPQRAQILRRNVPAAQQNPPAVGLNQAVEHFQQRAFAAAAGADQHKKFAAADGKRHIVQYAVGAVLFADVLQINHRFSYLSPS